LQTREQPERPLDSPRAAPHDDGEQQMLAIGPALATTPRLLREERLAAIIVEQHAQKILPIIDRC
jgi:ABC-type branched-subunit amino acid transport system ATPase component